MNPEVLATVKSDVTVQDDGVQTEPGDHPEVDRDANGNAVVRTKSSISWRLTSAGELDGMPHTKVTAIVNGEAYDAGTFLGSCSEIGASGGIDGKGLLAGELSAVQCWYAGGGNEVGVFAHEDGGFDILVGELSEGDAETALFRGDFDVKHVIQF